MPPQRLIDDPRVLPIVERLRQAGYDDHAIENVLREELERSPTAFEQLRGSAAPRPGGMAAGAQRPADSRGAAAPPSRRPERMRTAGDTGDLMDVVKDWFSNINLSAEGEALGPGRRPPPGGEFPRRRPDPPAFQGPGTPGPVQVPSAGGPAPYAPIPNPRAAGPGLQTRELPPVPPAMPVAPTAAMATGAPAVAGMAPPPIPPQKPDQTAMMPAAQPGAAPPPTQAAQGMNPFLQALAGGGTEQDAYMNLMNFGMQLMAASEAQPGSVRGPSLAGAVGRAGQASIGDIRAQKAGRSKAATEERRHQETLDLKRRQLDLESIRIAQDGETKRLLIEIDRDNKRFDRDLKKQQLDLQRYEAVATLREEYAARRQEIMFDPALNEEERQAALRANRNEEQANVSRIQNRMPETPARAEEAPTPEKTSTVGGQTYQKIDGQWFMVPGGS